MNQSENINRKGEIKLVFSIEIRGQGMDHILPPKILPWFKKI